MLMGCCTFDGIVGCLNVEGIDVDGPVVGSVEDDPRPVPSCCLSRSDI